MKTRAKITLKLLLMCGLLWPSLFPAVPVRAQDVLPPPHMGYGLHIDPNVPTDPTLVDRLGMDWVKLYTDSQIPQFSNKRILFRQDLDLTLDDASLSRWVAERARLLSTLGVDAIEVHNEPNLSLEWLGRPPDAVAYVQKLRVAYQAIKSVAPSMIVVSAGLAPTDTTPDRLAVNDIDYARVMLQNGAGAYFDVFGYHPYGYNAPPEQAPEYRRLNFRRAELIRELMVEFELADKQIWMTEFGWLRDPAEDGVNCSDSDPQFAGFAWLRVDGRTQADYIVRAFAYADANWYPWTGPLFLWNLNFSQRPDDGSLAMCSHMRWFGLLRFDGTPTQAFNRVASMPKRYREYLPTMTLFADEMTLRVGLACPGLYEVGRFRVANTGFPGTFSATIAPAQAPLGPPVTVFPERAAVGEEVAVTVNTRGLPAGVHLIYINVRTSISGQLIAQNLRGFVIVQEGNC